MSMSGPVPIRGTDPWHKRRSLRNLKKDVAVGLYGTPPNYSQVRAAEKIELCAITLTEFFTPSEVGALLTSIERLGADVPDDLVKLLRGQVDRKDTVHNVYTRISFAPIHHAPSPILLPGHALAATIPDDFAAVALDFFFPTVSVTTLTATFFLAEGRRGMAEILNRERTLRIRGVRVEVTGRLKWLRNRLPWSRPTTARYFKRFDTPELQAGQELSGEIYRLRDAAEHWMKQNFAGRLGVDGAVRRTCVSAFLTESLRPFAEFNNQTLRLLGLDRNTTVWRTAGWSVVSGPSMLEELSFIAAARRSDVLGETTDEVITGFRDQLVLMISHLSIDTLLRLYESKIWEFRRTYSAPGALGPQGPGKTSGGLESYIRSDGFSINSVVAEIAVYSKDPSTWTGGDLHLDASSLLGTTNTSLVDASYRLLSERADNVARDDQVARANIATIAHLQQIRVSLRSQRLAIAISLFSLVIAIISLLAK